MLWFYTESSIGEDQQLMPSRTSLAPSTASVIWILADWAQSLTKTIELFPLSVCISLCDSSNFPATIYWNQVCIYTYYNICRGTLSCLPQWPYQLVFLTLKFWMLYSLLGISLLLKLKMRIKICVTWFNILEKVCLVCSLFQRFGAFVIGDQGWRLF